MIEIPLTGKHGVDKLALVSDEDFDLVDGHSWYVQESHGKFYAVSRLKINGKWKNIRMHRLIMGVEKSSKPMVDHIDGNGLNNCRSNLRLATHSQNLQNADSRRGTSKYKGVYFSKQLQKYRAKIIVDKKEIMLGSYINEDDAARAYNYAAIEYFGEFARLNDVDMSIPITKNTIRKFRGVEPTQSGKFAVKISHKG